jgi:hypothetical protein
MSETTSSMIDTILIKVFVPLLTMAIAGVATMLIGMYSSQTEMKSELRYTKEKQSEIMEDKTSLLKVVAENKSVVSENKKDIEYIKDGIDDIKREIKELKQAK